MKKKKIGLFWKIVVAILAGVAIGYLFAHCGAAGQVGSRVFKTFNLLFSQVLKFIVPLLILGLVTPAIANAGKGAGKMLLFVMAFSYLSTCTASLFAYFSAGRILPLFVAKGAVAAAGEGAKILPYLDMKIPPVCDVLTALALAFMAGVGIVATNAVRVKAAADEFARIVTLTIQRVVIPGLPIYIMTMISEMTVSGKIGAMALTMAKVIGTGWALTIVFLVLLYVAAAAIAGKSPLRCLWNMAPAYLTGLSIASSAAVIPVTLECCEKNDISEDVRDFVVPLCANVHMVGSAIKMITSALAVVIVFGLDVSFAQFAQFTFLFAIAAVAAPGVMCGVLMASVGFLESVLGLSPDHVAVLMAFYMALDGYGPAANVTGDGAIALVADRFFGRKGAQP
ncbi:MAG: cation:dicarboxylase symporter family transporter [Kiritimatiellae bacterium]|nr:cation:dicarboxylase symporter family transporter [Kiritimatiellia bacterium]